MLDHTAIPNDVLDVRDFQTPSAHLLPSMGLDLHLTLLPEGLDPLHRPLGRQRAIPEWNHVTHAGSGASSYLSLDQSCSNVKPHYCGQDVAPPGSSVEMSGGPLVPSLRMR